MERSRKKELISELKQHFAKAKLVVLIQHNALTMSELNNLRTKIREAGAIFKVTKNSLVKRAIIESSYGYLADYFKGQTAMAFSQDEVTAAKVLYNFGKNSNKINILVGGMHNKLLSLEEVNTLAQLPSFDELHSILVKTLKAPGEKIVNTIQTPINQLVRVINTYIAIKV